MKKDGVMKHSLMIVIGAVATMMSFSCASEGVPTQTGNILEFKAVLADADETRTAIQSDGTSVWWSPGESINVFYGNQFGGKFTSFNTEAQSTASFRGTWTDFTGSIEEAATPVKGYWAVYPYDPANTCDGESVTLTVPLIQQAKAGSFADGMFPAIARSNNLDLAFYFVCGGVRFSVVHEGIRSVTFKSNAGESLSGTVKVAFGADGLPEVSQIKEGADSVVVNAPEGGFVPGTYYYAALLPQTLSKGMTVAFTGRMGSRAEISKPQSITVNRTRFGKVEGMDADMEFPKGVELVDPQLTSMWDYTKSSQNSTMLSLTLNHLLNTSYCQYNFLDCQSLSQEELDANDYSNAYLVKIIHKESTNNKCVTPTLVKIRDLLNDSQASSLRAAIAAAETEDGVYDDAVRNAILTWWANNGQSIYYQQVIDAWYEVACIKSYGYSYGGDIGLYSTDAFVKYNIDDTTSSQIHYATKIRLRYKTASGDVFFNDPNTAVYIICWKSIAILLYNTYYLQ